VNDRVALPSLLALLAANAVPLFGALFLGWSAGAILGLYWAESAVVGLFTVLKILGCRGTGPVQAPRVFLAAFFVVHFGIFMLVHGVFVLVVAGAVAAGGFAGLGSSFELQPGRLAEGILAFAGDALVALVALLLSHGFSFVRNFLLGGERLRLSPPAAMMQPYGRIFVMHLTLLFGTMLALAVGSSPLVVALLVVLKTAVDARQHLREHGGLAALVAEPPRRA
jgi:hypothetical protein